MSLKDELHDVKVLGGVRNYLLTLWQLRVVHEWDARRYAAEKARAERKERRLMKTSTWDALTETLDEDEQDPYSWPQVEYEAVMEDTIRIERRRWIERVSWILTIIGALGFGWTAGWYAQPQFKPEPWVCDVKVVPDAPLVEPTIMRCVGGEKPE